MLKITTRHIATFAFTPCPVAVSVVAAYANQSNSHYDDCTQATHNSEIAIIRPFYFDPDDDSPYE